MKKWIFIIIGWVMVWQVAAVIHAPPVTFSGSDFREVWIMFASIGMGVLVWSMD